MVKIPGLYFVIANEHQARFVRPDPGNVPHTIRTVDAHALRQPGVENAAATWLKEAHVGFADALARVISEEFAVDLFSDLVLVAPAHLLHELTAALEAPARAGVLGSITADLVAVPDNRLRTHLATWLPPRANPCDL